MKTFLTIAVSVFLSVAVSAEEGFGVITNYQAIHIECHFGDKSPWDVEGSMKGTVCDPVELRRFVEEIILKHPELFPPAQYKATK